MERAQSQDLSDRVVTGDGREHAPAASTNDLRQALDQRIWLLNELDHRVKNNLQLISSLMLLQARRASDPAVREALNSMLERLNAISTVHRRLFQSEDPDRFDVAAFARDLSADLGATLAPPGVVIELELEPVSVASSKGASLALLINDDQRPETRLCGPRAGRGTKRPDPAKNHPLR